MPCFPFPLSPQPLLPTWEQGAQGAIQQEKQIYPEIEIVFESE